MNVNYKLYWRDGWLLYDEFVVQYYIELLFLTCPCTFTMISIYMYLLNTDKKNKSDFKFSAIFSRISTFKKYYVHVNHMVFHSVTLFNRSSNEAGDIDILFF